jgi:hypothetical protein
VDKLDLPQDVHRRSTSSTFVDFRSSSNGGRESRGEELKIEEEEEEEEEEEAKGCGARKKMKEKMKGVRHYARVRQLRVPVFNIYMYIYYSDGTGRGRSPVFFTTRTCNPPRPARIPHILTCTH